MAITTAQIITWIMNDEAILDTPTATDDQKNAAAFRIDKNLNALAERMDADPEAAMFLADHDAPAPEETEAERPDGY